MVKNIFKKAVVIIGIMAVLSPSQMVNAQEIVFYPNDGLVYLFRIVEDEEGLASEVPEEKEFNEAVAYFESLKASDL